MATQRHRKPENWLGALARNGHGISEESGIARRDQAVEALLMGLRLREGVDLERIAGLGDAPVAALVDLDAVRRLAAQGLLRQEGSRLHVTPSGMLLLDAILPEIVRG